MQPTPGICRNCGATLTMEDYKGKEVIHAKDRWCHCFLCPKCGEMNVDRIYEPKKEVNHER